MLQLSLSLGPCAPLSVLRWPPSCFSVSRVFFFFGHPVTLSSTAFPFLVSLILLNPVQTHVVYSVPCYKGFVCPTCPPPPRLSLISYIISSWTFCMYMVRRIIIQIRFLSPSSAVARLQATRGRTCLAALRLSLDLFTTLGHRFPAIPHFPIMSRSCCQLASSNIIERPAHPNACEYIEAALQPS